MISTIIIISVLIVINFLLLKLSSNKISQRKKAIKPYIIIKGPSIISPQQSSIQLAPTGS
jgi:hypothetical protein